MKIDELKKSYEKFGPLYPVLTDNKGKIIDGIHRKKVDKNWPEVKLKNVDSEEKRILLAIQANWHRRNVSKKEKAKLLTSLCELHPEWRHHKSFTSQLAELTKFSERQIRRILPLDYKQEHERSDIVSDFAPRLYNFWYFNQCDERFGIPNFPGKLAGQVVQNVLYYWTNENDLVIDPMAGSGTTYDVSISMKRRCYCYDISPKREFITPHDIRRGYPNEAKHCGLILLDPPYWRLKKGFYQKEGVSDLKTYEEWLAFMEKLAMDSFDTVKGGGHVALILQPFFDEKVNKEFLDLPFDCLKFFERAGFKEKYRISTPLSTQVKSAQDVEYAKSKRILLDISRDLIIFGRNKS